MRRLLLVDDDIHILHAFQRTLRQCFLGNAPEIEIHTEPEEALLRYGQVDYDIVISDYRMPGINGVEFLKMVRAIQSDAMRLVLSASTEFDVVMNAINQAEVFRYITKPWQLDELRQTILLALSLRDKTDRQKIKLD